MLVYSRVGLVTNKQFVGCFMSEDVSVNFIQVNQGYISLGCIIIKKHTGIILMFVWSV